MIFKQRMETEELKILRSLNLRYNLSEKEVNYYLNLEKGYTGEQRFDNWLATLSDDWLILNDLLLEVNNSVFQIDSLLISRDKIYLFEIKNYEGDFYIDREQWYTLTNSEIKNPLLQLQRSESLLRKLLQELRFKFSVEAYLIFVNPEFYLYQAPPSLPIIFPTQINRFIHKLQSNTSSLTGKHMQIAKKLLAVHMKDSPFIRLPSYTYENMKLGITCVNCMSFDMVHKSKKLFCNNCGHEELVETGVVRSVKELQTLFSDKKITTNGIYEWCNKIIQSKKVLQKILIKHYTKVGYGKYSYYV